MGTSRGSLPPSPAEEKTEIAFVILFGAIFALLIASVIIWAAWLSGGFNGILALIIICSGLTLAFFEIRRRL